MTPCINSYEYDRGFQIRGYLRTFEKWKEMGACHGLFRFEKEKDKVRAGNLLIQKNANRIHSMISLFEKTIIKPPQKTARPKGIGFDFTFYRNLCNALECIFYALKRKKRDSLKLLFLWARMGEFIDGSPSLYDPSYDIPNKRKVLEILLFKVLIGKNCTNGQMELIRENIFCLNARRFTPIQIFRNIFVPAGKGLYSLIIRNKFNKSSFPVKISSFDTLQMRQIAFSEVKTIFAENFSSLKKIFTKDGSLIDLVNEYTRFYDNLPDIKIYDGEVRTISHQEFGWGYFKSCFPSWRIFVLGPAEKMRMELLRKVVFEGLERSPDSYKKALFHIIENEEMQPIVRRMVAADEITASIPSNSGSTKFEFPILRMGV